MRLGNAGEVLQHVPDGEVHGDARPRVAAANQTLEVLVLADELVLHRVPHHLGDSAGNAGESNRSRSPR